MLAGGDAAPRRPSRRQDLTEVLAFVIVLVVGIAVTMNGTNYTVQLGTDIAMFVTLAYSWNVISGFTGYISFGQVAFFGFGAFATAVLIMHLNIPWYFAAPLAAVLSAALALPLGVIMLRLRGIYFALGMYGLVHIMTLIAAKWDFTGGGTGLVVPGELALNAVFFYMVGALVLAFALNWFMARSRFGLKAKAVRDDEEAAAAMGVPTVRVKVVAYVLSATLPALAGGLVVYNRSFIDSVSAFDPAIDLQTILFAIAGGMGTLWGPLIGGVVLQLIGEQLWANYPSIQLALFGVLIILILLFLPGGVVGLFNRFGVLRRAIVKAPERLPELPEIAEQLPHAGEGAPAGGAARDGKVLTVEGVGVNFGGVQALEGIDLEVTRGETLCIIGANGAGKTTLFNAITGMVEPSAGTITFDGNDVSKHTPHALARRGLGRTFQIPRPFETMTVWENLYLAALGGRASAHAEAQAEWVVHILHLEDIWLKPVLTLPVGHRRLVELGRALALQPELILLDEVMAGMSQEELERVREAIRSMASFGVGAVAGIEHVIRAIVDLADRIVVLDEGRKIAAGPPEEIMRHPEVVRAYLGEEMLTR